MGLRGAEVGGRGPQRRRRALHVLVPLWRVHLCQPRNDRRLEGRLAADGNGLSLRCSREGVLGVAEVAEVGSRVGLKRPGRRRRTRSSLAPSEAASLL